MKNITLEFIESERRKGKSCKAIGSACQIGPARIQKILASSGIEQKIREDNNKTLSKNPQIIEDITQGAPWKQTAHRYGIEPKIHLKHFCIENRLFLFAKHGRGRFETKKTHRDIWALFDKGSTAKQIARQVGALPERVESILNQGRPSNKKKYWERRTPPANFIQTYNKKGQTQSSLAKKFKCSAHQIRSLCIQLGINPRVQRKNKANGLTKKDIQNFKIRPRCLQSVAVRAGCTVSQARQDLQKSGLIKDSDIESMVSKRIQAGTSFYGIALGCGLRVAQVRLIAKRLGHEDPSSRTPRDFISLNNKTSTRKASVSDRRNIMQAKMQHRCDISESKYPDFDKLCFVLRKIRDHFDDTRQSKKSFIRTLKWAYYDPQLTSLWCNYKKNPNKEASPSVDHKVPFSKGGSTNIKNLQFLSWFENRIKGNMTLDEWEEFKLKTRTKSGLFIDAVMKKHRFCSCQKQT